MAGNSGPAVGAMNGRIRAASMAREVGDTRQGRWCWDFLRAVAGGGGRGGGVVVVVGGVVGVVVGVGVVVVVGVGLVEVVDCELELCRRLSAQQR